MRLRNSLVFGVVLVGLAGCATTVSGTAAPVPGQGPVAAKADACSLISPEHADALGLKLPGDPQKEDKARRLPPSCHFAAATDEGESVDVSWSTDMPLSDYMNGAIPGETYGIAGFTWTRYATIMGKSMCSLSAELGEKSFIELLTASKGLDEAKACDLARAVAPAVASHLPGGEQNPQITAPPGQKPPAPSGPLTTADPCTMLKPDQATQLGLGSTGEPMKSTIEPTNTGCAWPDTDGKGGTKPLDLWFYPAKSIDKVPSLTGTPQDVEAGGKKWKLYIDGADSPLCAAGLVITETSTLMLAGGNLDDNAKACDVIKAAIPLVTGNLPAG